MNPKKNKSDKPTSRRSSSVSGKGGKGKRGDAPRRFSNVKPPPPFTLEALVGQQVTQEVLQRACLELYKHDPRGRYDAKHIQHILQIRNNVDSIKAALDKMLAEGTLAQTENGRYKAASPATIQPNTKRRELEGKVDMTARGAAYIVIEGRDKDIYVSEKRTNGALNGDRVRVLLYPSGAGRRPEGEVIEVVERATNVFTGIVQLSPKFAFVTPDSDKMGVDIFVPLSETQGAKNGERVVVKIVEWHGDNKKNPVGVITASLGKPGTNDSDMKAILIENGFDLVFPPAVLAEAATLSDALEPEEKNPDSVEYRRDLRDITTFTIDPVDAKDFDDALSYRKLENGDTEIGVHIADVTHYIRPSTALDEEAYLRSTSVYLPDRVMPMLPERISNELCSLRPHEDKRTFSVLFTFNAKNEVTKRWFGKTLTHSNRRFTYEEAQDILNTGEGDYAEELKHLNIVAYALRKARFKAGAIQFETPEVRFKLDPNGVPLEVYVKERQDSNMLVEDFMLLANRAVGEEIRRMSEGGAPIPFVYRIHDQPNVEKLEDLALYAKSLGFSMHLDTPKQIADSINALTVAAAERDELKPLLPLAIRTMAKAVYSTNNIGHYGLGFEDYTHFTSPIRRYSDVLSHRILYKNLTRPPYRPDREKLEIRCKHISTRERAAMTAERQAVKYKQAEFLEAHVGEIFEGIISGMTDSGFFVEIVANYCEGRIDLNNLREHFTRESPFVLKGVNTGKEYRMGQRISVRVKDVDRMARQITLELP